MSDHTFVHPPFTITADELVDLALELDAMLEDVHPNSLTVQVGPCVTHSVTVEWADGKIARVGVHRGRVFVSFREPPHFEVAGIRQSASLPHVEWRLTWYERAPVAPPVAVAVAA